LAEIHGEMSGEKRKDRKVAGGSKLENISFLGKDFQLHFVDNREPDM
jgi:hypothetical protein